MANFPKNWIVSFIGDLQDVVTAITAKALDTSMQYDTEAAWKLFGKMLKKLAADLKGPWGCAKELGGVSIF